MCTTWPYAVSFNKACWHVQHVLAPPTLLSSSSTRTPTYHPPAEALMPTTQQNAAMSPPRPRPRAPRTRTLTFATLMRGSRKSMNSDSSCHTSCLLRYSKLTSRLMEGWRYTRRAPISRSTSVLQGRCSGGGRAGETGSSKQSSVNALDNCCATHHRSAVQACCSSIARQHGMAPWLRPTSNNRHPANA